MFSLPHVAKLKLMNKKTLTKNNYEHKTPNKESSNPRKQFGTKSKLKGG